MQEDRARYLEERQTERRNRNRRFAISLLVLLLIMAGYSIYQSQGNNSLHMVWSENDLHIIDPAMDEYTLPYANIQQIHFADAWEFGICVDGGETRFYRYGIWQNEDCGRYRLYGATACASCIVFDTIDGITAISYESDETTAALFQSVQEIIKDQSKIE